MMKTLDLYLCRRILRGLSIAFIIVTGIIMLVDFVEASRSIGTDLGLSAFQVLYLTVLNIPHLVEQTVPFVVLFGVMGTLYGLNQRSELTVLRASGLSAWRFLRPTLILTGFLGIFWALIFNPLAAHSQNLRLNYITEMTPQEIVQNQVQDEVWLREGNNEKQTIIYAESVNLFTRTLKNTYFIEYTRNAQGDFEFIRRVDADEATLIPGKIWMLSNVRENIIDFPRTNLDHMDIETSFTLEQFRRQSNSEDRNLPSFWKLPERIQELHQAGYATTSYTIRYLSLIALPFILISMTIIAACVSMRYIRSGGTLRLMLTGGLVGFAVYFLQSILTAFGEAGTINIFLAVAFVPALALVGGVSYLSLQEDGS